MKNLVDLLKETFKEFGCDMHDETLDKITDCLTENGVTVIPCTVGQKVYRQWSGGKSNTSIATFTVAEIFDEGNGWKIRVVSKNGNSRTYDAENFGKTIFTTKKEVEENIKNQLF